MTAVASLTRVRVVVDHCHTLPTQLQIKKLKVSHCFIISVFSLSSLHLLSKGIVLLHFLLIHSRLMRRSFFMVNPVITALLLITLLKYEQGMI